MFFFPPSRPKEAIPLILSAPPPFSGDNIPLSPEKESEERFHLSWVGGWVARPKRLLGDKAPSAVLKSSRI